MRELKVLVACEFSGTVRNAFLAEGHDAWSCDLLPSADGSNRHIRGDVRDVLKMDRWDLLMVAHPPCTRLCNSGVRWLSVPPPGRTLPDMWEELDQGAALFGDMLNADVPYIAVENPVMHKHAKARIRNYQEFTQSIQPWEYGDNETKRTCLWLKGLPALVPLVRTKPANVVARVHNASPGPDRWKERSKFFPGIAQQMARQWSAHIARLESAATVAPVAAPVTELTEVGEQFVMPGCPRADAPGGTAKGQLNLW